MDTLKKLNTRSTMNSSHLLKPVPYRIIRTAAVCMLFFLALSELARPCLALGPGGVEFGILTEQNSAASSGFDFDGRFVVWTDQRAYGEELYAYDLLLQQEIKVSNGPAGSKFNARVSGGLVVWLYDKRDGTAEIWACDLIANSSPLKLRDVGSNPTVDLDGDWLVYAVGYNGMGYTEFYAWNLRTGETFPIQASLPGWEIHVSGNRVYYFRASDPWGMDWDVYAFDLLSRTTLPVKVGAGTYVAVSADGDHVLLQEIPDYETLWSYRLWLRNQASGVEVLLASGVNPLGSVSGNRVVFTDDSGQVMAYDISTGQTTVLSSGPAQGHPPIVLHGNTVVWTDARPPASYGLFFIYGYSFGGADTVPPQIVPPPDVTADTAPGLCSASNVELGTPTTSDNVEVAKVENDAPSVFPKGVTLVTWTATDTSGNTAVAVQTVTVKDGEAPVIACPGDLVVSSAMDLLVTVEFSVTASDNCDPQPTITYQPPSGSGFPVGATTVTCTATDEAGNTATCSFTVTRPPLGFAGFLPPLGGADVTGGSYSAPLRSFKLGSTIPVKFTATCADTPVTTGVHRLQVVRYVDATHSEDPIDAATQGAANNGNQFRFVDGEWHLNLSTKSTGMTRGIWKLIATLSDGSRHQAWIELR